MEAAMATVTESNDAFTAFWNDVMVPKFERFRDIMLDGLSYHSRVPLDRLALPKGSRALDVGCGWGDTAIELARKVGPTGKVVGLDCCDAFLQKGRDDAAAEGLAHVRFVAADVQAHRFEREFDFAFSRFGMMFFANPVAAMRNVRSAMVPGATLMFITWRVLEDNPWLAMPKSVVLRYLPPPGENAQTCGPGPFSMANPDVVRAQLHAAGFTDVAFERVDGPVMVGRDVDEALDVQMTLGPAGEIVREAGALADGRRDEIEMALRDALQRHVGDDGRVWMQSSSWTITARNPG
jgi:ubiquinone/menaquinone biosynthesis C-methylase UbiE